MSKNSQNPQKTPFEIIRGLLDDNETYDVSVGRMYRLLQDGKVDMHVVAEACVASVSVPILTERIKQLNDLLDKAEKDIRMFSEERKEMAIALQDGMTIEKEKEQGERVLRVFVPKGVVVN